MIIWTVSLKKLFLFDFDQVKICIFAITDIHDCIDRFLNGLKNPQYIRPYATQYANMFLFMPRKALSISTWEFWERSFLQYTCFSKYNVLFFSFPQANSIVVFLFLSGALVPNGMKMKASLLSVILKLQYVNNKCNCRLLNFELSYWFKTYWLLEHMLRRCLIWKKPRVYRFLWYSHKQTALRNMAASGQNRFGELSPDEIQKLLDNATAKSTMKATKFGMKIFNGKFCYEMIWTVTITEWCITVLCF